MTSMEPHAEQTLPDPRESLDAVPKDPAPLNPGSPTAVPFDAAPVDAAPVDAAPVDAAPVNAVRGGAVPLDVVPLEAGPLDPAVLDDLWDLADPSGSERRLRGAVDDERLGSTAHAELTTQLARSIGLQDRFDEANSVLDTVALQQPTAPIVRARLSLERGRLINSAGRTADAMQHFLEALRIAESAGQEFLAVDAAHMLAITDRERSEVWTDKALQIIAASHDPRTQRWAGSLHNNAGWAQHDAGDYSGALEEFQAALAAYSIHGTVEQVRVARWAVARAMRSLAQFDAAMSIQLRLAEHAPADGYVEEELAELALATGQQDLAREHAANAAELLGADHWFAQYESGRLDRLRQIAGGN